jgi:hypothetical protein
MVTSILSLSYGDNSDIDPVANKNSCIEGKTALLLHTEKFSWRNLSLLNQQFISCEIILNLEPSASPLFSLKTDRTNLGNRKYGCFDSYQYISVGIGKTSTVWIIFLFLGN